MNLNELLHKYIEDYNNFQRAELWVAAEKMDEMIKLIRDYIAVNRLEPNK